MKYICDTCVLIDYLRGRQEIKERLAADLDSGIAMSSVTYMELMVGAFNKEEAIAIRKAFSSIGIIEISEPISVKARELIDTYTKSHGLLIPDALIAATALETGKPLYTLNVSDFRFINGIVLV